MVGASHTFQFSARDLHGNVVSAGSGRFAAAVRGRATGTAATNSSSNSTAATVSAAAGVSSAAVTDFGNGTYEVTAVFHGSGLQYVSVYIASGASLVTTQAADPPNQGAGALASASLPGSPYQVFVQQPNVCSSDDVLQVVGACNWKNKNKYVFSWLPGRGPHDDVSAALLLLRIACIAYCVVQYCCCVQCAAEQRCTDTLHCSAAGLMTLALCVLLHSVAVVATL
jgi:hypothetical protein